MYYECLGFKDNDPRTNIRVFRVYLELYRDCQAQNAAYFDARAHMTVFSGDGAPYDIYGIEQTGYTGPEDIDPPTYPCLTIPPNVCVHKALYTFDVELEISAESYHLVWQRCCRNQSINNIYSPGEVGSSFWLEITPLAQQRCNNSPRFKNFPPTVICLDEPLVFDHGATDVDGDNIVYELCAPLTGGGRFGGTGCDSPNPNPDCPPPYNSVTFRAPEYTANQPLGFNANMSIDQTSGMITARPQTQGQFVVGVCMKEYRNGQLMSIVRRDFQFNVSTCTPNFAANVFADEYGPNNELIIKSCDDLNVEFDNRSTGNINSVLWVMDFKDSLHYSMDWEPTIQFPHGGEFNGLLIVNPQTPCTDTAELIIRVTEELKADFSAIYDTCEAGPVELTDESLVKGSRLTSWDWNFSQRMEDTVKNPIVTYEDPGDYLITLQVEEAFGCRDTVSKVITYQPAPEVIIVEPSVEEGCAPLEVAFKNLSYPINNDYDVKWIYSDGGEESGFDATHVFQDTGVYSVKVEITSPIGCYSERFFDNVIAVYPPPKAGFSASSYAVNILDPTIVLEDTSYFGHGREWLLEGYGVYFDKTLDYTFADTGRHEVRLIAVDRFGCADTLVKYVDVAPVNTLHFPNAFSPNGDGKNDIFEPVGLTEGIRDYKLSIFNRYGEMIFESTDVLQGWDGTLSGKSVPNGVYIMNYQYKEARGQLFENKGFITVVR